PLVTCLNTSLWHANPDFCVAKSCTPPDIMNGNFNYTTDLVLGTTIIYTCDMGYRLVGQESAQCVLHNNEVFWDNVPYCASIPCSPPPAIENGQSSDGNRDFTFGMAVTYTCNRGFSLIGDPTIHCTVNKDLEGVWSGPPPECKVVRCKNPEVKNGKKLSGFGTEYTYRHTVTFECYPGYLLNGSSTVTCEADNSWNPPVPTCEPGQHPNALCKEPPTVDNGMHNGTKSTDFVPGSVVVYKCKDGFTLTGAASIHCKVDHQHQGVWSKPTPECQSDVPPVGEHPNALCKEPPTVDNGMHNGTKGTDFVHGSVVVYKCKDGFTLTGVGVLRCIARDEYRGVWSKPPPECRGGANMIIVGIFPLLLAMLIMNI
ncbi:PREDICTED: complement receptor type 2-like, partial [Eurypyga helias]|uniref:complement receptor type 2-like n=1 Tax=Eurypyga helias TaxID=54383 RepID=UPI0005289F6F